MKHKLRALGCSIFAGGFTVGVSRHFDVLAQFEESNYGVATMRKNFPKLPVHYPVSEWPLDDPQFNELDLIYGNPACAAWSVAGYTKTRGTDKWKTDERVQQTVRHFNLLKTFKPKVWVTESVTQAYTKGQEFFRTLEHEALELGYNVYYLLHDTKWLGVAQSRKRMLMVCSNVEVSWPASNWAPPTTALECLQTVVPTRLDWTVKIEPLVAKWLKDTYYDMPAGMRFRTYWENFVPKDQWQTGKHGQIIGRPSFGHKRLPLDKPSDVIVGYALLHPTERRFITINEMQALCGFPPDYEFVANSPNAAASLIARGVCIPIAEWFAKNVAAAVEQGVAVTTPKVFHVELRNPPANPTDPYVFELPHERELLPFIPPAARTVREEVEEPGEPRVRKVRTVQVPTTVKPGEPIAAPKEGEPRMAYLQRLIQMDRFTAEQMVAIVKHHWSQSKVSEKDVSTQRRELKLMGEPLPEPLKFPKERLAL
jgi:site-specific DNA-cytosine methylase